MKTPKMISAMFASLLIMTLCFTASNSNAQAKDDSPKMMDYCMMKDGKMMYMKDGKMMPMVKSMTMKNGIKCKSNGECTMKNGKKMKMKEGECMDMDGNKAKSLKELEARNKKMETSATYTCSMHPEVSSDKPGKCSKCGMDLVKKN